MSMTNKDVIYISVNNWFCGENFPPTPNFRKWLGNDFNQSFRNDEWCKENKLCVYYGCVDMSQNYTVSAPREWVEKNCPELLTDDEYTYITRVGKPKKKLFGGYEYVWEDVEHKKKYSDFVFGTTFSVTYQCDSDMSRSIKAELMKVDYSLSPFNKESIITAVNQNREVKLDTMFLDVYNLAMQISKDTEGAFDITVAPLVNAWGFGFKNKIMPTKSQVDSLMQLVGYQKISLENGVIHKADSRMMLDCSAIAKGYGSDAVAKLLRSRGVKNFMVEVGGEIEVAVPEVGYAVSDECVGCEGL